MANRRNRRNSGAVVTMGTFDGVHRGHQTILHRTVELAARRRLSTLAVTFAQPPRLFFFPEKGPSLLTILPEKIELLKRCGIERVEVLPFGKPLASLSAADFFQRYFVKRFQAREIVVGYNFGFGRGRKGDTRFLEEQGNRHGVAVHVVPPMCLRDVPVSSGQVRQHLLDGDLGLANLKLGYPSFVTGKVVRGDRRGRRLGYPTANVDVDKRKIVPPGVFAVQVQLPDGHVRPGVCNVGTRPTLRLPEPVRTVEVYLLDFKGELLGRTLRLYFISKLRSEKKFGSLQALSAQIEKDEAAARRLLVHHNTRLPF